MLASSSSVLRVQTFMAEALLASCNRLPLCSCSYFTSRPVKVTLPPPAQTPSSPALCICFLLSQELLHPSFCACFPVWASGERRQVVPVLEILGCCDNASLLSPMVNYRGDSLPGLLPLLCPQLSPHSHPSLVSHQSHPLILNYYSPHSSKVTL